MVIVVATACVVFAVVWGGFLAQKSQAQIFKPHYVVFEGVQTRIYLVSESTSYATTNQTYVSSNGVTVAKDSAVFTINLTLRNDYSSDNPPPNSGTPTAPVDGTTYIPIQPYLFDNNGNLIPSVNISPSDFTSPAGQTGLVLASGQTVNGQLILATQQDNVASYTINLASIGDSVPR
jgi:hypothetical protein